MLKNSITCLLFIAIGVFLQGCGRSLETPFDGDVSRSPFAGMASLCVPTNGQYAEQPVTITRVVREGKAFLSEGGGCVLKSVASTWAVAQTHHAVRWEGATLIEHAPHSDSRAHLAFKSKYEAGPWPFTQSWIVLWLHSILAGSQNAPTTVLVAYKKISGTSHIELWDGAVELREAAPNVTSVLMRNRIAATRSGEEEARGAVRDFILRLRSGT